MSSGSERSTVPPSRVSSTHALVSSLCARHVRVLSFEKVETQGDGLVNVG